MCQWVANKNPYAGYRMGPYPASASLLTLKPGVEKSSIKIVAAKRSDIDIMCQWGANMNPGAGYLMGPSPTPAYVPPNREVANRRPQIVHIMIV